MQIGWLVFWGGEKIIPMKKKNIFKSLLSKPIFKYYKKQVMQTTVIIKKLNCQKIDSDKIYFSK